MFRKQNVQRASVNVEPAPPWQTYTNAEEEQRLIIIADRLERKLLTLNELYEERRLIRARAIRRMRRATGKE